MNDVEDGASSAKPDEFGVRTLVSIAFVRADGKDAPGEPGFVDDRAMAFWSVHR